VREKTDRKKNGTGNEIILGDLCYIYIISSSAGTAGCEPGFGAVGLTA